MRHIVKTFQEWKDENRHVRKGEKSIMRNAKGECLFSLQQTEENLGRGVWDHDTSDLYYDEDPYSEWQNR